MSSDSSVTSQSILGNLPKLISNRLEVRELIGRGGVGVVLKCKDNVLNNTVAVKLLLNDVSKEMAARFQREAITAARLNHRNIVRVSDFGQNEDGRLFLVMEYLEGGTLYDEIQKDGAFPLSEVLPILIKVCDGLSHAHNQGVLHRDVKPSNVMLSKEPNDKIVPKLVDFGLARLEKDDQQVTTGGRLMGSPSYLSPETARGIEPDVRSDIYSMGCLIFECLTGVPPFLEDSAFETLNSKLQKPPPTLFGKSNKHFPAEVESIVAKCLSLDPAERYSTVNELKQALEELYELEEVEEGDDESDEFSLGETLILSPNQEPPKVARKLNYRNIAILILLLAAVLITIFYILQSLTIWTPQDLNKSKSNSARSTSHYKPSLKTIRYNNLNWFKLEGGNLEDALTDVKRDSSIRSFQICDQRITGIGARLLPSIALKRLSLKSCIVDDEAMRIVSKMPNLEYLDLTKVEGITDKGLSYLTGLKSLKRLGLSKTEVTDKIFDYMPSMHNLQTVELLNCHKLNGKNLEKLVMVPHLTDLSIGGHNIGLTGRDKLSFLTGMPGLKRLQLSHLLFSDKDLKYISKMQLRVLYLSHGMITNKGIQELASMGSLRKLTIDDCLHVTMHGITDLRSKMPNCNIHFD